MPRRPRDREANEVASHVFDVFRQLREAGDRPLLGHDVEACFVAGAERAAPAILKRMGRDLDDAAADVVGMYLLAVMREAVVGLDRSRFEAFERSRQER